MATRNTRTPDTLRRNTSGAVYVEFLVAFIPFFVMVLGMIQEALMYSAHLVVQHAAASKLGTNTGDGTMQSLLEQLDKYATDWAKIFRWLLVAGVVLHGIASLTAAGSAAWQLILGTEPHHHLAVFMTAAELTLISVAVLLGVYMHWRHGQARWIELRLATERAREQARDGEAGALDDPAAGSHV
jgi:hypothetical protein